MEIFYLRQIQNDLQGDIKEMRDDIQGYTEIEKVYKLYIEALGKKPLSASFSDSLLNHSFIFFTEIFPLTNNVGLETLRNTGKLDLISNKKILTQLTRIHQDEIPALRVYIESYLQMRRNFILPLVMDKLKIGEKALTQEGLLTDSKFKLLVNISASSVKSILDKYNAVYRQHLVLQKMIREELEY